ncbi:MFS transporter, partial [Halorubrum sp. CBA1125]|uniref:MFS transporter n=1 Tax=Halorubrum sp. CBA1125 TaxID=2668072 RepID=UPI00135E7F10|nr:MFS transporter [Halorubrum sp. CBA1125]
MDLRRLVAYDVLALTSLVWFLGKFVRYAFPPIFGTLQASYGVSNAAVGAAYSGLMIVYALLQFPSGAIADRIGAVRVIATGAAVAGVGS